MKKTNGRERDDYRSKKAPVKEKPNAPIKKFKSFVGSDTIIDVAVWANVHRGEGRTYTIYNTSFQKSYRGDDGEWHNAGSYSLPELAVLRLLLDMAASFVLEVKAEESENE